MIKVYSDEDFNQAYRQKNTVLYVFLGVFMVYLAGCIACLCYHISLPYAHPNLYIPKWIVYVLTVAFVCFSFPFMGIKFRRVNKYYKMLYYISSGIKNEEKNYFVKFEKCDIQKDNVDAVACVFMTWNRKKQEWMKRELYFDVEKPLPEFSKGDLVRYISQSNFIIEYEILAKSVLEIEEIDGYGEYGQQYAEQYSEDFEKREDCESEQSEPDFHTEGKALEIDGGETLEEHEES